MYCTVNNCTYRASHSLVQDAANVTLRSETLWETVCNAIIANGGVREPLKMSKTCAMMDASNTVQVLVACAMKGIRFSSINCLWWGGTKETGSQMKACAIHIIWFTQMNYLWLGHTKEKVSQIKVSVIEVIHFKRMNCLRLGNTTETVSQINVSAIDGIHFTWMNYLRSATTNWNS